MKCERELENWQRTMETLMERQATFVMKSHVCRNEPRGHGEEKVCDEADVIRDDLKKAVDRADTTRENLSECLEEVK